MGRASRKTSAQSSVRESTTSPIQIPGIRNLKDKVGGSEVRWRISPKSLTLNVPVEAQSAAEAYRLILNGEPVKFRQNAASSANIEALQKAAKEDKEVPLHKIYGEEENLFLLVGDLQLHGKPREESWAAKTMKRDENGFTGGEKRFLSFLQIGRGYEGEPALLPVENLRATRAIDTEEMRHIQKHLNEQGAIFVTNDDYIISGNDHWAALADSGKSDIPVIRMPRISSVQLLSLANEFMQDYGIDKST